MEWGTTCVEKKNVLLMVVGFYQSLNMLFASE